MAQNNNRAKEKRKTIETKEEKKIKKKNSKSHFFFFKNFLSLNISPLPSYFVGHFVGKFFVTHRETDGETCRETESSAYRAAMSQLKKVLFFFNNNKKIYICFEMKNVFE